MTAGQAARMNLIIKGIQIPAYIMHFILGFIGLAMSVWGIGFLLWAVLIDLFDDPAHRHQFHRLQYSHAQRKACPAGAIFMGIGCFYLLWDVAIAIVYVVKAGRNLLLNKVSKEMLSNPMALGRV